MVTSIRVLSTLHYNIHTVINSSANAKIKVVSYRRSSILIGQAIFPTNEYNRPTNQRPHTIGCH